jgi:hypothetical protein
MAIRLSGMTLGGKLSLGYLCVATFLFLAGGRSSEWFLMVLGFPLLYAPWLYEQAFGELGRPRPVVGASLFVLLWVGNAYLWGHSVAAVVRWLSRRFGPPGGSQSRPNHPLQLTRPATTLYDDFSSLGRAWQLSETVSFR